MSYRDIVAEIRGIPKMSLPLSQTLVNRALEKIYDESLWSFQLGESGWFTPTLVNAGTITTTMGSNIVVGDPTASAAWAAIPTPFLLTNFQIRLPAYAIYSIVDFGTGSGYGTGGYGGGGYGVGDSTPLTLDRPWMEPQGADQSYQMYQCYFPAPAARFKRWLTVRDFTNAANLDWWSYKQSDLDASDPQRTVFQNPALVVGYKVDTRTGSATLGRMLFELYPGPLAQLPYALYYAYNPPPLALPGDTVPFPLSEEVVVYRAKEQAYIWCEENKGRYVELQKSDFEFLAGAAKALYDDRIRDVRKTDRDLSDPFWTRIRRNARIGSPFYSAVTGAGQVGSFGGGY